MNPNNKSEDFWIKRKGREGKGRERWMDGGDAKKEEKI